MVDIISIVDGIINQLITWGAPPCTKSDFMPSSVHGTLRNGRSTWFALAQTSACKGKRFIKGTPLLSLLPLIGFVQGYVKFAGKVWFLAGKKGWSCKLSLHPFNGIFTHRSEFMVAENWFGNVGVQSAQARKWFQVCSNMENPDHHRL